MNCTRLSSRRSTASTITYEDRPDQMHLFLGRPPEPARVRAGRARGLVRVRPTARREATEVALVRRQPPALRRPHPGFALRAAGDPSEPPWEPKKRAAKRATACQAGRQVVRWRWDRHSSTSRLSARWPAARCQRGRCSRAMAVPPGSQSTRNDRSANAYSAHQPPLNGFSSLRKSR